jgi:subtilase family serine protease
MPKLPKRVGTWTRVALALGVTAGALTACQISTGGGGPTDVTSTPNAQGTETAPDVGYGTPYTPQQIRDAYGITSLFNKGNQGQGQTIVFIESYGSPTLSQDLAVFDEQFGLPAPNLQVIAPLGAVPYDANQPDMVGWQTETTLDVEMAHAVAPKANLVVLTSPVDETEGVQGLPEFLKLEQYNVEHHLGTVVSNSWAASEASLNNAAGLTEIAKWDTFLQQAVTQSHITFFASSGDNGSTDCVVYDQSAGACSTYSSTATASFPNDSPWMTSVGGTTLMNNGGAYQETVWNSQEGASGGGFSEFYSTPTFQKSLPASVQSQLNGRRGVPDVAAAADPSTGLTIYGVNPSDPQGAHTWSLAGGTSAAAPFWAGVAAIANQIARRPLGYLNPAFYKIAESSRYSSAFRDVTSGDNTVATPGDVAGYQAGPGWDAATGLGTPDAAILIPLLIQDIPG